MSKFTQNNYGNAQGIQIIPKGREKDFVQNNFGNDGHSSRVVVEEDEVQNVIRGEVKFQSNTKPQTNPTFTQYIHGGTGFQSFD